MARRCVFVLCAQIAVIVLLSVQLGSACFAESKSGPVLFQESFDDAKLKDRGWYDMTRISIVGGAAAGKGCIEYDWPDRNSKGTASSGLRHLFTPTDKVHIRFYIKLSKGFGWTGRNYHPHILHFMTTENSKWHGPAASHLTLYIEPVNGKLRLAAQDIQNKDSPHGLTQGPLKGGHNGTFYDSKDILFKDDEWHCIEAFFKLNTLDVKKDCPNKDGTVLGWFDGKLVIMKTDVVLRSTDFPTMKFNQLLMAPYFGPGLLPHAQKLWMDELVVSTRRIGPLPNRLKKKSWTSSLYPKDWTPAFTDEKGRFLHDFSYAGYRQGRSIPSIRGRVFDVTKCGADRSGKTDATRSIQDAIDAACRKGGIVRFPSGTFRIDGILTVNRSGVVLRGAGADKTRLWFSSAKGMKRKAHLLVTGKLKRTPLRSLVKDGSPRDCSVTLTDVAGLKRGDEIAIGIVNNEAFRKDHGMEEYWRFSAGKWRPLFRRTIRAVDRRRKTVSFTVPLRYHVKVRWGAALAGESGYIANVGIESMAVSNASSWVAAWKTNQVAIIELADAKDCWVKGVSSYAAEVKGSEQAHLQSCGIRVRNAKNITIADCAMFDPAHRGGGGNGYLFEIRSSNEILTRDCVAMRGRHNFIQNWDFGTSGCVWLRIHSDQGEAFFSQKIPIGYPAMSEYHHALSMANLVDCSRIDDGWNAYNRRNESSGAGHTATQCVIWNALGEGTIRSYQYGWGYVIGTGPLIETFTATDTVRATGTKPEDFSEGLTRGAFLKPQSLYEDQRKRRLGK